MSTSTSTRTTRLSRPAPLVPPPPTTTIYRFSGPRSGSSRNSNPALSLSLAASHAVRLSLRAGNIADAFRVVNTVRVGRFEDHHEQSFSGVLDSPNNPNTTTLITSTSTTTPTTTPSASNGRLPTHTLLHGLIKLKRPKEAANLAEQMMRAGMSVRARSLQAVFGLLSSSSAGLDLDLGFSSVVPNPHPHPRPYSSSKLPSSPSSNTFPHSHSHSHSTDHLNSTHLNLNLAQTLLETARQTRTKRTHKMIKTLLALALLNGEIVLASLVFGGLVREWRGRKVLEKEGVEKEEAGNHQAKGRRKNLKDNLLLGPYPAWSHLAEICGYIDESVEMYHRRSTSSSCGGCSVYHPTRTPRNRDCYDEEEHESRILKPPDPDPPPPPLVMEPGLRFSESIQALANVVGVLLEDTEAEAVVLPFVGLAGLIRVLYRCLDVLERKEKVWIWDDKTGRVKRVEAKKYLKGVMKRFIGRLPLKGQELTQQTYNTVLYYALVHARSRSMADGVLESMVRSKRRKPNGVTVNIVEGEVRRGRGKQKEERKRWVEKWKARLDQLDLSVTSLVQASNVDGHTLSTRIGLCVASGRPDVVAEAVPHLLLFPEQAAAAVMRAVAYGPVVMTSMLSALMKAGKTGLLESVWTVARQAEALSWDLAEGRPWCLGIQAYTVMIQAYAKESKKVGGFAAGWGMTTRRRKGRAEMGRFMAMKTFRLVAEQSLLLLQKRLRATTLHLLRPPVPDAHFFNAILDVFARAPPPPTTTTIRPRSTRSLTRKKARTRFLGRVRRYVWEGRVMGYYSEPDPRLREVVARMRECGFADRLPLLVRRILVGRREGVESGGVLGTEGKVWVR